MPNIVSPRDKLLQFDPNNNSPRPWATYNPRRAGSAFKTHTSRAIALRSYAAERDLCALYEWSNGRWELILRKDREAQNCVCDGCGGTTENSTSKSYYTRIYRQLPNGNLDTGCYVWVRAKGKILSPLMQMYVCEMCYPIYRR